MKTNNADDSASPSVFSPRFCRLLLIGCVLMLLLGLLRIPHRDEPVLNATSAGTPTTETSAVSVAAEHTRWLPRRTSAAPTLTAEEIVAGKLLQFTSSRRELARLMAKRKGVAVPDEVERFFDTLASGNWEEIDRQFAALSKSGRQYEDSTSPDSPKLDPVWCAVLNA